MRWRDSIASCQCSLALTLSPARASRQIGQGQLVRAGTLVQPVALALGVCADVARLLAFQLFVQRVQLLSRGSGSDLLFAADAVERDARGEGVARGQRQWNCSAPKRASSGQRRCRASSSSMA